MTGRGLPTVRVVLIIEFFCFRRRFVFLVAHREVSFCQFLSRIVWVHGTWFERYISLVSSVAYRL